MEIRGHPLESYKIELTIPSHASSPPAPAILSLVRAPIEMLCRGACTECDLFVRLFTVLSVLRTARLLSAAQEQRRTQKQPWHPVTVHKIMRAQACAAVSRKHAISWRASPPGDLSTDGKPRQAAALPVRCVAVALLCLGDRVSMPAERSSVRLSGSNPRPRVHAFDVWRASQCTLIDFSSLSLLFTPIVATGMSSAR